MTLDKKTHGDDLRKAVKLKLRCEGVPIDVVERGFCAQLSLLYGKSEVPQLVDIEPLKVSRTVNNVLLKLGSGVEIRGADLEEVTLAVLAGKLVDVEVTATCGNLPDRDGIASALWSMLMETVDLVLEERQPEIVEQAIKSVKRTRRTKAEMEAASAAH